MNDYREALHAAVEDLCEGKNRDELLRKWSSALTNVEAIIVSLPECKEQEIALQHLMECAWWVSLILTDAHIMDKPVARRTVRRMHKE